MITHPPSALLYTQGPLNPALHRLLDMHNGTAVCNLLWLSIHFDENGLADLSGPRAHLMTAAWRTTCCRRIDGTEAPPYSTPHSDTVAWLLHQPAEVFVEWLFRLPRDSLTRLPMYVALGPWWPAHVKQRAKAARSGVDEVVDLAAAQALLRKLSNR